MSYPFVERFFATVLARRARPRGAVACPTRTPRHDGSARSIGPGASGLALPWLAGALAALWIVPAQATAVTLASCVALGAALAWRWRSVGLLCCLGGLCWTSLHVGSRLDGRLNPELAGRDFAIAGWVDGFPQHRPGQTSFSLTVTRTQAEAAVPRRLRLTWYDPPVLLEAGMTLELEVRLREPRGLANPGGFDYERWLFVEGYGAAGYVRSGHVAPVPAASVARAWLQRRAAIAARIAAAVDSADARALLIALALGERFAFEEAHWTTLRRTGTSHLVAISGLHVGIVSALLFFLARWVLVRGPAAVAARDAETAAAISFLGASVYSALAGFSVPTQRALVMLAVALACVALRRSATMASGLSIALLAILIWDPLATLSASFWLSFIAVALLWQLALRRALPAKQSYALRTRLLGAVRVQWGITLGLLPVVVSFFGEVSLVAPLVNLVAIPLCSLVLVPLTLVATVGLAIEPVGTLLFGVASRIASSSYIVLEWVADEPWSAIALPELGLVGTVLLYAGIACALPVHGLPARYLGWVAALAAMLGSNAAPAPGALRVTVLDVGHGLAVLAQTRNHALVYDLGPSYRSGFDSGTEIVVPAARSLGVAKLDVVVLSHADNDHSGGFDAVLNAYPDAVVLAGPDVERTDVARCRQGQRWRWDGVDFELLYPPMDLGARGNDSSCVLRVHVADTALIVLGDLERYGERALVAATDDLGADVAIVPHHGSATSSSAALVSAVGARYAIVSAAYANRWGFPKPEVVARWQSAGATVLVTGEVGAIAFAVSSDGALSVDTERRHRQRPWHAAEADARGYSLVL